MDINATREEKMKLVYDCLVDGLPFFSAYGLRMSWKDGSYEEAERQLNDPDSKQSYREAGEVCREDIWAEIVNQGDELIFYDDENDGALVGRLDWLNIDENWPKILKECPRAFASYISENYDAGDTDSLIQVLIFGEVVYGYPEIHRAC